MKRKYTFIIEPVINLDESYVSSKDKESKAYAIIDFLKIIKKIEIILKSSLTNYGKYKFRVTRQHYAIMKNALAKQYLDKKKKLYCYTGRGLWLLIDNSYNLKELETLHPDTADDDNEKVQEFFNGIKESDMDSITQMKPKVIVDNLTLLNANFPMMAEYNKNLKLHIEVQEGIKLGITQLTELLQKFKNNQQK